jgi:hypothetical protein
VVEALELFFEAGKVPSDVNELTWDAFKTAVRNFNSKLLYKDIKRSKMITCLRKCTCCKSTRAKDSEDFAALLL